MGSRQTVYLTSIVGSPSLTCFQSCLSVVGINESSFFTSSSKLAETGTTMLETVGAEGGGRGAGGSVAGGGGGTTTGRVGVGVLPPESPPAEACCPLLPPDVPAPELVPPLDVPPELAPPLDV